MFIRAARKMMVPQPQSFQISWIVTRKGKNSGVVIRSTRGSPAALSSSSTTRRKASGLRPW